MNIKIRNGIQVKAEGGLIVEQAWLQYASGPLIREGNIVNTRRKNKDSSHYSRMERHKRCH